MSDTVVLNGVRVLRGWLDAPAQARLVEAIREVARAVPFVTQTTPGGRPMSVRMTAAGRLGWISDRKGYRYAGRHPSGVPWPPIPEQVLAIWSEVTGLSRAPARAIS